MTARAFTNCIGPSWPSTGEPRPPPARCCGDITGWPLPQSVSVRRSSRQPYSGRADSTPHLEDSQSAERAIYRGWTVASRQCHSVWRCDDGLGRIVDAPAVVDTRRSVGGRLRMGARMATVDCRREQCPARLVRLKPSRRRADRTTRLAAATDARTRRRPRSCRTSGRPRGTRQPAGIRTSRGTRATRDSAG